MAENKKSFLLYCDIIHTIQQLSDEQAGNLFKHILQYVNDENPSTDNVITNIAFEPIKQQLKLMLLEKMKISTAQSPELNLKSFVLVCSKNAFHQLKKYSVTQISQRAK